MKKFSVLVCSYNADYQKLQFTLDSILKQDIDDFEIIICDDGSKENNEQWLVNYFQLNQFDSYQLVLNSENKGTVHNLYSGLKRTTGKYVKPIGAGDALCERNALQYVYDFMENNSAECVFCDMSCFQYKPGRRIILDNISIPLKKHEYQGGSYAERMKENIIVFNDQIGGASLFYKTDYFKSLMARFLDKVKYMEDLCQYYILLEETKIHYIAHSLVAYEIGEGISTLRNKQNNLRMLTDKEAFLNELFALFPDDKFVKRRELLERINKKYTNKIIKGLMKCLAEPKWIVFRIARR